MKSAIRKYGFAVILVIVAVLLMAGCSDEEVTNNDKNIIIFQEEIKNEETSSEEQEEKIEDIANSENLPKEDLKIETPYCTLYYPGEWEEFLLVEINEGKVYTVTFKTEFDSQKEQELFNISFGQDLEKFIGTIETQDGKTVDINISTVEFVNDGSFDERESNIIFTMLDAVNYVIEKMSIVYVEEEKIEKEESILLPEKSSDEVVVENEYCNLYYPARWEEYLEIESKNENGLYSVAYYCDMGSDKKVHLFTVAFGGEEGMDFKTVNIANGDIIDLKLVMEELNFNSSWSEAEINTAYAMQEDLNYLFEKLP